MWPKSATNNIYTLNHASTGGAPLLSAETNGKHQVIAALRNYKIYTSGN